jgi:hypothetical protein
MFNFGATSVETAKTKISKVVESFTTLIESLDTAITDLKTVLANNDIEIKSLEAENVDIFQNIKKAEKVKSEISKIVGD